VAFQLRLRYGVRFAIKPKLNACLKYYSFHVAKFYLSWTVFVIQSNICLKRRYKQLKPVPIKPVFTHIIFHNFI
jgi:hypothetical protein